MPDTLPLEILEQNPARTPEAVVVWLHGLGADGYDFAGVPSQLGLPPELAVRYVFPHAQRIPVSLNMGLIMRAWYDIQSMDARGQDERGIRRSHESIRGLIDREVERGVAADRIVLAGFSQGGAMALFTGLRYPDRLAGIMCLSGYLLLADALAGDASPANRSVPIFQAHGMYDEVVPLELGLGSCDRLTEAGYAVEWREYAMAHQVCLEELRDIGDWLGRVLAK